MTISPSPGRLFPRWVIVIALAVAAVALLGVAFAVGRATAPKPGRGVAAVRAFAPTARLRLAEPARPTGTESGGNTASANNAGDQLRSELGVAALGGTGDATCGSLLFVAPVTSTDRVSDDPVQGLQAYELTTADATRGNYGAVARQFASIAAAQRAQATDVALLSQCGAVTDNYRDVSPSPTKIRVPGSVAVGWTYESGDNSAGTTTTRVIDLRVENRIVRATCTMTPADERATTACSSWLKKLVAIERLDG